MSQGLRERKKAETRRALASAAVGLADRHGPDGVTVEAIAEAAGVSPRTFFNYFASKDDAIVGATPANASLLLQGLLARDEDEAPVESLRAVAKSATQVFVSTLGDWEVRQRLFKAHPVLAGRYAAQFGEVERLLVEEVARRTGLDPDADTYPAVLVASAMAAIRTAMSAWQVRGRREPLPDVLDEAFDHLTSAFARCTPALSSVPPPT